MTSFSVEILNGFITKSSMPESKQRWRSSGVTPGGDGDDGQAFVAHVLPQVPRDGPAIDVRHLHVEQDEIVPVDLGHLDAGLAVDGGVGLIAQRAEHGEHDLHVGGVVLDDENLDRMTRWRSRARRMRCVCDGRRR